MWCLVWLKRQKVRKKEPFEPGSPSLNAMSEGPGRSTTSTVQGQLNIVPDLELEDPYRRQSTTKGDAVGVEGVIAFPQGDTSGAIGKFSDSDSHESVIEMENGK